MLEVMMVKITSILYIHVWVSIQTISLYSSKINAVYYQLPKAECLQEILCKTTWKFNSPSTLVFALMVTLGSL